MYGPKIKINFWGRKQILGIFGCGSVTDKHPYYYLFITIS